MMSEEPRPRRRLVVATLVVVNVLVGLPFLDALLALARGTEVVADPDRLTVRSWRTETSIAWDDVEQVDLARGARASTSSCAAKGCDELAGATPPARLAAARR